MQPRLPTSKPINLVLLILREATHNVSRQDGKKTSGVDSVRAAHNPAQCPRSSLSLNTPCPYAATESQAFAPILLFSKPTSSFSGALRIGRVGFAVKVRS